jgi:hypothetical protein
LNCFFWCLQRIPNFSAHLSLSQLFSNFTSLQSHIASLFVSGRPRCRALIWHFCPILLTPLLYLLRSLSFAHIVPLRTCQACCDNFNSHFCLETFSHPSPAPFCVLQTSVSLPRVHLDCFFLLLPSYS